MQEFTNEQMAQIEKRRAEKEAAFDQMAREESPYLTKAADVRGPFCGNRKERRRQEAIARKGSSHG